MQTTISPAASSAQDAKPARKQQKRRSTPSPRSFDALAVCDGHCCAGWVTERDGAFFAFTPDGELYGRYVTQAEAASALPYVASDNNKKEVR